MTTRLEVAQLLARPLVWVVRLYQLVVSPLLVQQCRFYPSCSAYAVTALTRFGIVRGSWLTLRRLARCHPWNPGGVDHVPPAHVASCAVAEHDPPGSRSRTADTRGRQQASR